MANENELKSQLIERVKESPVLYEKTHPDYKNIEFKRNRWTAIAEELEIDTCEWNSFLPIQYSMQIIKLCLNRFIYLNLILGKLAESKWKGLVNQFRAHQRKLKKPSGSGGGRPFFGFEKAMMFLKDDDQQEKYVTHITNFYF